MNDAQYWFRRAAINASIATSLVQAACLNIKFLPAIDVFQSRAIYFLVIGFKSLAITAKPFTRATLN